MKIKFDIMKDEVLFTQTICHNDADTGFDFPEL